MRNSVIWMGIGLLAASSLALASTLHAADGTWTYDGDGNWTDGGNWSGGTIADGVGFTANFTAELTTANRTVTLNGSRTIGNITFTDGSTPSHDLTLSGDALTIDVTSGAPIINVTQSDRTLTIGSVVAGNEGLTKNGSGALALSAANTYTGDTTINGGRLNLGGGTASGSLATTVLKLGGGSFSYTRTGNTTQIFATTTINAGASSISTVAGNTLKLGNIARTTGGVIDIGSAGTITTTTANDIGGILGGWATIERDNWAVAMGNDTDITGSPTYYTTTTGGNTAANYLNKNVDVDSSPTFSGAISANSVRFGSLNTRTLTLTGNNTINSGGILVRWDVQNRLITITGGNLAGSASGDLVIHQHNPANNLSIGSIINNNGGATALTKAGAGKLILTGNNSYTGATYINAGTLEMASNLIGSSLALYIGNNATLSSTGGFTLTANQAVTGTGATGFVSPVVGTGLITAGNNIVSSSGTLTITRFSVLGSGNQITGGDIRAGGSGTFQRGLLVGNGDIGVLTISGGSLTSLGGSTNHDVLGNIASSGDGTLIINGGAYVNTASTGTLNLGLGTASGTLTLTSGSATINTLIFNAGASGTKTSSIVNLDGGTLTLSAITVTAGATKQFNFNGGQFIAGANLPAFSGVTLNVKDGGAKINTSGYAFTISDPLLNNGTGGLTKSGAGTLTLSGANTYSGGTTVSAGTLTMGHANALGSTSGQLTVTGATTLLNMASYSLTVGNLTGTGGGISGTSGTRTLTIGQGDTGGGNYQGIIADGSGGTTALTKTGSGTITLSGANTYTGTTTINAGILALGASGTLDTGNNVVLAGGTLSMGTFNNSLGTLDLTQSSTLALGSGTLSFTGGAGTWAGTLNLTGSLGANTLRFGTDGNGLTETQLNSIRYEGRLVVISVEGYILPKSRGTLFTFE